MSNAIDNAEHENQALRWVHLQLRLLTLLNVLWNEPTTRTNQANQSSRGFTWGRERTRRVRFTICRSFVPEMEEKVWGRVLMSKMKGFCSHGVKKWVPSPTVSSITPRIRSKITALWPPSTVYSDALRAVAAAPSPKAACPTLLRKLTAAWLLPILPVLWRSMKLVWEDENECNGEGEVRVYVREQSRYGCLGKELELRLREPVVVELVP